MVIHIQEFVYGNIHMKQGNSMDSRILEDDNGNSMMIRIGDEIIYANNSPCQCWIGDGVIQEWSAQDDQRMLVNGSSIHVGGECYIGRK